MRIDKILDGVCTMSEALLKAVGGRNVTPMGADPTNPDEQHWNFGITPKTIEIENMMRGKRSFYDRFPKLVGKWDGNTSINHVDAFSKIGLDPQDFIQYQPRGTCGGRSGSAACDFVQAILIASGKRAKIKRVSHAALYYFARKLYGMLSGRWDDDNQDGVASGSIPEAMVKFGLCNREEAGDANAYGEGSDDLACQLGAGMNKTLAQKLESLAKDNIITEWAPVYSAAEAADAIAASGIIVGSDSRGFVMNRDNEGFCSPRGTWYHYHIRTGVRKTPRGRKGFDYWQSWGKGTPSGTLLPGCPGNCFGVDWDVQDKSIRSGEYAAVFGFPLWELEEDKVNVDWSF